MTKSKQFLNYFSGDDLSIDEAPALNPSYEGNIGDIAEAVTSNSGVTLSVEIQGNEIDLLESGSYWLGSNVSADALETIHALFMSHKQAD